MPKPDGPQFTGPFYHGSPARFEKGDHVKPGIMGVSFASTDKEKANIYGDPYEVEPVDPSDLEQGHLGDWEVKSKSGWRVL